MNPFSWNRNVQLSLAIVVLTGLWMLSGLLKSDEQSSTESTSDSIKKIFSVQIRAVSLQDFARPIQVTATTEAARDVKVSAEVEGLVVATPAKEGAFVAAGDVLCQIEQGDKGLLVEQTRALKSQAQIEYDGALKLKDNGFQSDSQIASAKANLALAHSSVKRAELDLQRTEIKAPFAGVVEERFFEVGGFIQRGSACARLLEISRIRVVGELSEDLVSAMSVGANAIVEFGWGESREGKVVYLAKSANPTTRTYRLEVELDNTDARLISGLTAKITVTGASVKAHLVNSSLLSLLGDGRLSIKTVEQGKVKAFPVTIVGDGVDGIWVHGIDRQEIELITVGQQYVNDGQKVSAVSDENQKHSSGNVGGQSQ